MTAPRNRRHVLVHKKPTTEKYSPHPRKIPPQVVPSPTNRAKHAAALKTALKKAGTDGETRRAALGIQVHGAEPGVYLQFESPPGVPLKLDSLENKPAGIELVAVQEIVPPEGGDPVQKATVFVPDGGLKHFLKRFEQYANEKTPKGDPRHKDSVDRIAALRLATLEALWTDAAEAFPGANERLWWEVWLRKHDDLEYERLVEFGGLAGFDVGTRRLEFEDRIVVLAYATPKQLSGSLDVLGDFAEVRKAKQSAAPFVNSSPPEQAEWVQELLARTSAPVAEAPAVCILDTGVTREHPLLEIALAEVDATAVDPDWGPHDDGGGPEAMGHGTEMAGLALYGDLAPVLASSQSVRLQHRLESVKILPPRGSNKPELYGAITAESAYRSEIAAPRRRRAFSLAVTAPDNADRGRPSSWSAAIDALASGRSFDPAGQKLVYLDTGNDVRRLFVVAAGNVSQLEIAHLDRSDTESVHDPGQAWNALTVAAFTEKALIRDAAWRAVHPLAMPGDLSPWSTTGVTFGDGWPMKPDVVLEGGNIAHDGNGGVESSPIPDLRVLTTHFRPAEKAFVLSWATSAATAQASRMAAIISAQYPDYWPETVRALIVHSAEWTAAMQAHLKGAGGKAARARLLRRYGFGVPSLPRALRSADDALTLVVQGKMKPFAKGKFSEVHFHDLPWPKEVLEGLGQASARLRVTLSYFVEPNPGRLGWKTRHRYASHGFRFDVRKPTESAEEFRKRLNESALDDGEEKPSTESDSSDWFLGERARNRGSLHADIWVGSAADLAERGMIAVFPVSGWWKDQPKHDRSELGVRYSLIVSIETEAVNTDIWTPVAQMVGIPIEATTVEVGT